MHEWVRETMLAWLYGWEGLYTPVPWKVKGWKRERIWPNSEVFIAVIMLSLQMITVVSSPCPHFIVRWTDLRTQKCCRRKVYCYSWWPHLKKKNGHPASDRAACLKDKGDHGSFFDPVFHDWLLHFSSSLMHFLLVYFFLLSAKCCCSHCWWSLAEKHPPLFAAESSQSPTQTFNGAGSKAQALPMHKKRD